VLPVVEKLVAAGVTVSIDTTKAAVARAAVAAGARYINDVSGGLFDPDMAAAIGGATYICGHLRGRTLREVFVDESRPVGWTEVAKELRVRLSELPAGARSRAWVDPGIGFGKGSDPRTNLELFAQGISGACSVPPSWSGRAGSDSSTSCSGLRIRPTPSSTRPRSGCRSKPCAPAHEWSESTTLPCSVRL